VGRVQCAIHHDVRARRADVGGAARFAVAQPSQQLHLDRDRKILILHHRLRRRRVNHQAVVTEGPSQIRSLGVHLLADESVFRREEIVGKGIFVEKVSELVRKLLPLVVAHLQQPVFNSKSKTYDGDQWVRVEVLAHGDESIKHIVEGETVLEYSKPQIGGGQASPTDPKVKVDGTPLTGGYISIQAETAPIDFRKIELLNLEGCMDPKATNFKSYYVKSAPATCKF